MISATKKWIFLKVSSVVLVPLMLWFLFNLVSFYDKSYEEVLLFFTSQPAKFIFSLFIIFAYFYSALSISEVFEDYIENEKLKNVANKEKSRNNSKSSGKTFEIFYQTIFQKNIKP